MEKELNELLEKIAKLDLETYKPAEPNLFYMLGIEHNEVLICRLIAVLIQPNGLHGLGTKPLEVFLNEIGINDYGNLDKAEIILEEKTDNDRRVDIAIYLENEIVPIEVKIWAKDQKAQLCDYYNYYKKSEKSSKKKIKKIFYLSPNGKNPSEESIKDLSRNLVRQIHFENEIKNFLKKTNALILNENEVSIIIADFISVIERMNIDMVNEEKLRNCISKIDNEDTLSAMLKALKYKDSLWDEIRFVYFKNSLEKFNKEYLLGKYEQDDDFTTTKDICCKYIVKESKKTIAYICIDTNLYIVRKFKDGAVERSDWKRYEANQKYAWKYIKDEKNNKVKWQLNTIDMELFSKNITWGNYLE